MTEKEVTWVISWIYKNPKLVKINNRQKKNNIKNYLLTIDMSLSDFKKLVIANNSIPSNKRTTNYFNSKLSNIFVQPFNDSLTCFVVSPIKLVVEESGRIYCTDYNQVKCYLDEYNYIWSCDKNNLMKTVDIGVDIGPDQSSTSVVISARGSGKTQSFVNNPKFTGGVDWANFVRTIKTLAKSCSTVGKFPDNYNIPDYFDTDSFDKVTIDSYESIAIDTLKDIMDYNKEDN